MLVDVHPYSATDAQEHEYELALPEGTVVTFSLIDACSASFHEVAIVEGALAGDLVEAKLRAAFARF